MGFFQRIGFARRVASGSVLDYPTANASQVGIVSPWAEGQLQGVVWSSLIGAKPPVVTRADAMSLPSVAIARSLIIGTLAGRPLRALRGADVLPSKDQPSWCYRTDTGLPTWFRTAWTLDDWIFYGHSLWGRKNGTNGDLLDAYRVPIDAWHVDAENGIMIGDEPADPDSIIYLPGPFEGLLNVAGPTLRGAIDLQKAWLERAATPLPMILLKEREQSGMTQDEATEYVNAVAEARRNPNGAVMFIPTDIEAEVTGEIAADLMEAGRNSVKLDISDFLNLNASALDAALHKSSLNYETTEGQAEVFEDRMPYWTGPFEARLSMDDVCSRGQRIAFDFSDNPDDPNNQGTGPYQED